MSAVDTAPEAPPVDVTDTANWPYRFAVIPVVQMIVDESYQRPLTSFVQKIEKNFDPSLVGTLVLSERAPNVYAVVDGWTRKMGAERRGVKELPCIVYSGLTPQQEAALFAKLQKERRGIASYHRFRAAVVAGEQEACEIQRLVEECGYEIGTHSKTAISAVAGLETVYRRDPLLLERTLVIFRAAWKDKHMPAGDMLRGMGRFLASNQGIDDEKMASRLSLVAPIELKKRANALHEGMGSGAGSRDRFMAGAFEGVYRSRPKGGS